MSLKQELMNKQGITLGELLEFVAKCTADEMPPDTRCKARLGWRQQLQSITFESGE